jgi:hypothetical protein
MKKPVTLTLRELGTVLAALRYWQRHEDCDSEERYLIAEEPKGGALSNDEIDDLCERLNFS